jgi:hypothetical protein
MVMLPCTFDMRNILDATSSSGRLFRLESRSLPARSVPDNSRICDRAETPKRLPFSPSCPTDRLSRCRSVVVGDEASFVSNRLPTECREQLGRFRSAQEPFQPFGDDDWAARMVKPGNKCFIWNRMLWILT